MKKILLAILGSFILVSSTTFSCPNKELHNTVTKFIKNRESIHVEGDKILIANEAFVKEILLANKGDIKETKETIDSAIFLLMEYAGYHDLEVILLSDIKGWIK